MSLSVRLTTDAAEVLAVAGEALAADPLTNNLVLRLLEDRARLPQTPGRYWIVERDGSAEGVVFQSPLDFFALVTPLDSDAVKQAVSAVLEAGGEVPGVSGDPDTAGRFARCWSDHSHGTAALGVRMNLRQATGVSAVAQPVGRVRDARPEELSLVTGWLSAFHSELDEPVPGGLGDLVGRRLEAGQFCLWDNGRPVALAGWYGAVAGVIRVGPVYTPPPERRNGYGAALVAELTARALAAGQRCVLAVDESDTGANALYEQVGYRRFGQFVRYDFSAAAR